MGRRSVGRRRVRKTVNVSPRPSENTNQKERDPWLLRKLQKATDKVVDEVEKRVG